MVFRSSIWKSVAAAVNESAITCTDCDLANLSWLNERAIEAVSSICSARCVDLTNCVTFRSKKTPGKFPSCWRIFALRRTEQNACRVHEDSQLLHRDCWGYDEWNGFASWRFE